MCRFGLRREDHYAWMKPGDWQAVLADPSSLDAEIKDAISAENAYAAGFFDESDALSRAIEQRLIALQESANVESGAVVGDVFYFDRNSERGERVLGRRDLRTGQELVLLDMAEERKKNPVAKLSWEGPQYSPDRSVIGWAVDKRGSGAYTITVCCAKSGDVLLDDVENCHGSFAFDKSGRHLFWVGQDDKGRSNCVWRRKLGDTADLKCFESDSTSLFIGLKTSHSGDFVFIRRLNSDQSETWFIPAGKPSAPPSIIEPLSSCHDYEVEHWRDEFVIRTNINGAEDYKLVAAPVDDPGKNSWRTLVSHKRGRYISGITPFRNALVRYEWRDAKPTLVLMTADGRERVLDFPDAAYSLSVPPRQDYESDHVCYQFSSPIRPPTLLRTSFSDGQSTAVLPDDDAKGIARQHLQLIRLEIPAADGALIPVTLLSRKDSPPVPRQPLYLLAYGAYGDPVEASFRPEAIALIERGWTFAIAHVRGGGERGSQWWRPTLKRGKKLTFSDFTTCAQTLITYGMASERNIVAHGMSAGGLLTGAVFATHPHLWAAVIAQSPFVDVLNTLDDWQNHPLGSTPFANWGDPRVEEDYRYMASYSPYDALKPAKFPALLATGGVLDDRVAFWEPLKFAAKARALNQGDSPILAQIDFRSGHCGDPSPEGQRKQLVRFLSFAIRSIKHEQVGDLRSQAPA
ncbi:MAG: prolyl oligopeptidase family serine peptidase [Pseudomonadota bacterium]